MGQLCLGRVHSLSVATKFFLVAAAGVKEVREDEEVNTLPTYVLHYIFLSSPFSLLPVINKRLFP